MPETKPLVSIGMPVYNGANFLHETLDSILSQTYSDLELVISDNASTDETRLLCESLARKDPRVRYVRQPHNLGAAANYNAVFRLARGKYFKWAAHDDLCAPTLIERCVDVLERREEVVLVFSRCEEIDETGTVTHSYPSQGLVDTPSRFRRFYTIAVGYQPFVPVFGVMRRDILARTRLIGKHTGSDFTLNAELALWGRFYEIQEPLFQYRVHPHQSWGGNKSYREHEAWYDPERIRKLTFPHWRLLAEHERSIWRVPMTPSERLQMQWVILRFIRTRWRGLYAEISSASSPY
jgi:glycosyltransferase involved in cell wall biosynthesis